MRFLRHKQVSFCLGIFLLGVAALVLFVAYQSEPRYGARKLSYWLAEYQRGNPRAEEAVRAIGPKAIPVLLRLLLQPDPSYAVERFFERSFNIELQRDYSKVIETRNYGTIGFQILGAEASGAIPTLITATEDRRTAPFAWHALSVIGQPALPFIERSLTSTNRQTKKFAVFALARIAGADPLLGHRVITNADPAVRADAYVAFAGHAGVPASRMYAFLEKGLYDPDDLAASRAATALRVIGDPGTNALPKLYELVFTTNPLLRAEVALTIKSLEKRTRLRRSEVN